VLGLWLAAADVGLGQPLPHHFSGIDVSADHTVTLNLGGSASNLVAGLGAAIQDQFSQMFDLYAVDTSTNLLDWTRLVMLPRPINDLGPLVFQGTLTPDRTLRFYRTLTNHLITSFPEPSGPFAVGTFDRVMVDPARTNSYRYGSTTNAIMVTFWYPAAEPEAGVLPGPRWNRRLAGDASFYEKAGGDTRWTKLAPALVGYRFRDARLAAGQERYPILMFSHCNGTHRAFSSHIAEELASHGYVVLAPDHPDCHKTEFPDGRYLAGASSGDTGGRLLDFQFLLDEVERLDAGDPFFGARLDLNRIGIYGLIYGGMVAEVCRRDARVKCAALLEAENLQVPAAGLQKPFLAMNHTGSPRLAQSQNLFTKASADAVWLQVSGADRFTFSDAAWGSQIPWGRKPALAIDACLVWFFDTLLKGQEPAFPAHPELIHVNRK
jgi:hypothetical protein